MELILTVLFWVFIGLPFIAWVVFLLLGVAVQLLKLVWGVFTIVLYMVTFGLVDLVSDDE